MNYYSNANMAEGTMTQYQQQFGPTGSILASMRRSFDLHEQVQHEASGIATMRAWAAFLVTP